MNLKEHDVTCGGEPSGSEKGKSGGLWFSNVAGSEAASHPGVPCCQSHKYLINTAIYTI